MPKTAAERLATFVLLLALAAQIALALRVPPAGFGGDEPYYVAKASYFFAHHRFPRATPNDLAIENGRAWGQSDWRPQGYAVFLALCSGGDFTPPALRPRVTAVQSLLIALAIFLAFRALRVYSERPSMRLVTTIVLGIAPWPFAFAPLLGPDSVVASITAIALLLLGRYPKSVFFATLLFSITFTLRPEMIVLPPLIVACAALYQQRHRVRFVVIGAAAFLLVLAAHYAYRIDFTGQRTPPVFGGLHIPDRGAFAWVNTWIGTEHEAYDFVYALTSGQPEPPRPPRALANAAERRTVDGTVAHVRATGRYGREDDAASETLAEQRRRENGSRTIAARLWYTAHLWLNTETSSQTLTIVGGAPPIVRRGLLGALLLLKLAIFAAFALFLIRVRTFRADAFLILCAVYVVARTALIGLVLGWFTHRYALSAWIPLLACAAATVSRPFPAVRESASPRSGMRCRSSASAAGDCGVCGEPDRCGSATSRRSQYAPAIARKVRSGRSARCRADRAVSASRRNCGSSPARTRCRGRCWDRDATSARAATE